MNNSHDNFKLADYFKAKKFIIPNIVLLLYSIYPWIITIDMVTGKHSEGKGLGLFIIYIYSLLPGIVLVWPLFANVIGCKSCIFTITILSQIINFIIFNIILFSIFKLYNKLKK